MNINQDDVIQCIYLTKKEILLDILAEIFSLEEVYELICNNEKLIVPKNSHNTRLNIKATNIQHIDNNINIEPSIVQKLDDIPIFQGFITLTSLLHNMPYPAVSNNDNNIQKIDDIYLFQGLITPIQELEPLLFQNIESVQFDPSFRVIGRSPYF